MRCRWVWLCLIVLVLAGCAASPPLWRPEPPIFPPQTVMTHGDYGTFVSENLLALQHCGETPACAMALFNLSFVYAYPQSPYYDPLKALPYFNELLTRYPQTPWAFEGQVWKALMNEKLILEEENHVLEQEKLVLRQENWTLAQAKFALEETQRRLQADLHAQETIIRNLQERLKRSRDIDIELEKKARELLR